MVFLIRTLLEKVASQVREDAFVSSSMSMAKLAQSGSSSKTGRNAASGFARLLQDLVPLVTGPHVLLVCLQARALPLLLGMAVVSTSAEARVGLLLPNLRVSGSRSPIHVLTLIGGCLSLH